MNRALETTPKTTSSAVLEMAQKIAFESPGLADLSQEQLQSIAEAVILGNLKEDLAKRSKLARIPYEQERETFLAHAGKTRSPNTRRAYASALARLEDWAAMKGLPVLEMKPRDADDYAYSLQIEGRASSSVRRDIAGASSFFTYLERRFDEIRNPFRGTKARPEKRATKEAAFPSKKELSIILPHFGPDLQAAFYCMAYRGLRVGALPSLALRGDRFTARSKGKDISGEMPKDALKGIKEARLDERKPFEGWTATRLADCFRYATTKLHKEGHIRAAYSVHDLRHFFALEQYQKTPDIYQLKELLGHASIQVTELYLKGLGVL